MAATKATAQEIRKHFNKMAYEVKISQTTGQVQYRRGGTGDNAKWIDGRYVDEYRVIDGDVIHT